MSYHVRRFINFRPNDECYGVFRILFRQKSVPIVYKYIGHLSNGFKIYLVEIGVQNKKL